MKVLLVADKDYCNVGYSFSKCLQKVGVDAKMFANKRNQYLKSGYLLSELNGPLRSFIKEADTVVFMHSDFVREINISGKRVFVFHGGHRYRKHFVEKNKIFNRIVKKSLIQTGDLLGLGAKNEVWIMASVDTETIKPCFKEISEKIIISHFPSGFSKDVKGSYTIERVIKKLKEDKTVSDKFIYNFSPSKVLWEESLKRMSECDIYLEACKPTFDGCKYGEFGISGFEAAALGKILVTHFISSEKYKQKFGDHPVQVVNSEGDIEKVLRQLLMKTPTELHDLQIKTREWVEKFHSFEVVGRKLKRILEEK